MSSRNPIGLLQKPEVKASGFFEFYNEKASPQLTPLPI